MGFQLHFSLDGDCMHAPCKISSGYLAFPILILGYVLG